MARKDIYPEKWVWKQERNNHNKCWFVLQKNSKRKKKNSRCHWIELLVLRNRRKFWQGEVWQIQSLYWIRERVFETVREDYELWDWLEKFHPENSLLRHQKKTKRLAWARKHWTSENQKDLLWEDESLVIVTQGKDGHQLSHMEEEVYWYGAGFWWILCYVHTAYVMCVLELTFSPWCSHWTATTRY